MALVEKQVPYEFLARWTPEGKFSGAHVQFATVITDDATGEVKLQTPGKVMPVDIGAGQGFPIADILAQIQTDAINAAAAATAAQTQAEAERDAAKAAQVAAETALANAHTSITNLAATIVPSAPPAA